jgi:hypothetical protein
MNSSCNENCFREKQNTVYVLQLFYFFRKSCLLWENVGKYVSEGQTTDHNVTGCIHLAYWITKVTDTYTPRICSTYCFFTVTMVTWKPLVLRLYVHRLPFYQHQILYQVAQNIAHWSINDIWIVRDVKAKLIKFVVLSPNMSGST